MKKHEIKVGGLYLAKVSGVVTTVRVDAIREGTSFNRDATFYDVANLRTGRKTTFRSAAKFRGLADTDPGVQESSEGKHRPDPTVAIDASSEAIQSVAIQSAVIVAPSLASKIAASEGKQCADPTVGLGRSVLVSGGGRNITTPTIVQHATLVSVPFQHNIETSKPESSEGKQCADPSIADVPLAGSVQVVPSPMVAASAVSTSVLTLASRIVTSRITRKVDAQVAGMTPNAEQESILAVAVEQGLKVLVVGAGAGTGKTATLKMLEQVLPGRGQYTAFNTSLVAESKAKFQKAACNTTHSLAFRAVGKQYQHRLGGERMRSSQIARILGIEDMTVLLRGMGAPDAKGKPTDKPKRLTAEFLAGQVLTAIRRFCQSADREIGVEHLRYIDGIDVSTGDGKRGYQNNDSVRDYLLPFARKAWDDLSRIDGQLPFSHDCYVKLWQLGQGNDRPIISADYILLDEAQDTAPVFLDVLKQQTHALLVLVGDDNQQIYEWRGAVNAMGAFKDAPRRLLSQSYRFGQAIADVANAVLATLEEPTDLVMRGNPDLSSRVAEVAEPRCYLYRTNAGAVGRVMTAIEESKKPHLIGGGADVVAWCQAAVDLQAKRGTRHPELCCFETWSEVVEYSKTDEGDDLRLMVKLVTDFGAEKIRDALKDMPKEENADVVVSTAHKSKGREWDTVKLGPDFPLANKMSDADRRLLYVAATRAKLALDISDCPPFCGGEDKAWGAGGAEARWVPGLKITYTAVQHGEKPPTVTLVALSANEGNQPLTRSILPTVPAPANGNGKYTWCNDGGVWCVRGPANVSAGSTVRVERKDGSTSSVTIRQIVRRFNDAWIYGV